MNKRLLATVAAVCIAMGSVPAAQAATNDENPISFAILLPVRAASLVAGAAVGAPVSTLKHTTVEVPGAINSIASGLGGDDDGVSLLVSALPGAALGTAIGVIKGVRDGTVNSFNNFYDKPFSQEAFSLTDDD